MPRRKKISLLDKLSYKAQHWLGTPQSLVAHTCLFLFFLALIFLGFDKTNVMLVLTTIVSLEAIYLSLFIQMGVNRHEFRLKDVEADVDDIGDDVDDIMDEYKKTNKKVL